MDGNDDVAVRRGRRSDPRLAVLLGLAGLLILAGACQERPDIRARPVHPDIDTTIRFEATRGEIGGTIDRMRVVVDGDGFPWATGASASATLVPTPEHSNEKVRFRAVAKVGGSELESEEDWVYVVNPRALPTPTTSAATDAEELAPVPYDQPSGDFDGWPAGVDQQTGPNLYRLDKDLVGVHAEAALQEYAGAAGIPPDDVKKTSDGVVRAVAWYVQKHAILDYFDWEVEPSIRTIWRDQGDEYTEYEAKNPGQDFALPADLVLEFPGGAGDFLGDCEDMAILRAALLRRLGFHRWSVWSAINTGRTHEYNLVIYGGAYRILDTYEMDSQPETPSPRYETNQGWNERHGPRWSSEADKWLEENADNWPGGKSDGRSWGPNIYLHPD